MRWGLPESAYRLGWEVRDLEAPGEPVVRRGTAIAAQRNAYAVHVEVTGLRPGRAYGYRFTLGDEGSEGVTRTAPAPGDMPESCVSRSAPAPNTRMRSTTPTGSWPARSKPQFIVHLGDYIYEQTYDEYYQRDEGRGPKKEAARAALPAREECPAEQDRRPASASCSSTASASSGRCPSIAGATLSTSSTSISSSRTGNARSSSPGTTTRWTTTMRADSSAVSEEDDFLQRRINAYRAYSRTCRSAFPRYPSEPAPAPLPPFRLRSD